MANVNAFSDKQTDRRAGQKLYALIYRKNKKELKA